MQGINKAILIGVCAADAETKTFGNGGSIVTVRLATSESWTDKAGQKQEKTEWHTIVFRDRLGEQAQRSLRKGAKAYIEGAIRNRKYKDRDGKDTYITEINASVLNVLEASGIEAEVPPQQSRPSPSRGYGGSFPFNGAGESAPPAAVRPRGFSGPLDPGAEDPLAF